MTMTTAQFSNTVLPGIREKISYGAGLFDSMIPKLFSMRTSTESREQTLGFGGISVDAWDGYGNSGAIQTIDFNEGHLTTFTHSEFAVQMVIKRSLLEDDLLGMVGEYATEIGISAAQKRELDAASVFNNTALTGGDGLALFHAAHTGTPDGGVTQDNLGASALSASQLTSDRILMRSFTDDKGNPIAMNPNEILVPVDLEDTALTAVGARGLPGTANNDINPQAGRYTVHVWDYLTDTNNWFLMDSLRRQRNLIWYDRTGLELKVIDTSITDFIVQARMRYSFGWSDWRFAYGNIVA